jgi:hypothetical protein
MQSLHQQFEESLKNHTYMGLNTTDPSKLQQSAKKEIRLQRVFQIACAQIEADLKKPNKDLDLQISLLQDLENDGQHFYDRYDKATKGWTRSFLKGIAFYTPNLLKKYLPSCISGLADAEKKTLEEYNQYKTCLKNNIDKLIVLRDPASRKNGQQFEDILDDADDAVDLNQQDDKNKPTISKTPAGHPKKDDEKSFEDFDEEDFEAQAALWDAYKADIVDEAQKEIAEKQEAVDSLIFATLGEAKPPSAEEIEEKRQQDITTTTDIIQNQINCLKRFNEQPLSLHKYKKTLCFLADQVKKLLILDADHAKELLIAKGLSETEFDVLSNLELTSALITSDNQKLQDLLKSTEWHASLEEALAQQGHIKFGVRRFPGNGGTALQLVDDQGKRLQETALKNYRGKIALTFNDDVQSQTELDELVKFLKANDKCHPCHIEIQIKEDFAFTSELFKLLLELSDHVSEIQLNGLQVLDFKKLNLSADEEYQFVQHLDHFLCPDLKDLILSDHPKDKWLPTDFSSLLSMCPKMELLKDFYRLCSQPQNIEIPAQLCAATELDLSNYPIELIPHLLQKLTHLKHLNLTDTQITDAQLTHWYGEKYLVNIETLRLDGCKSLTTDILHVLPTLPHLTKLSLPDLPKGKQSLDKLPKLDNPFKIKLFYISSKETQKIASQLYTGPMIWAAAFQIPLARMDVSEIFPPQRNVLDPKSVAYWLHSQDYKKLTKEPAITTIQADSNASLNDDNLVEFAQKFPNLIALCLYNCPNVTQVGIIKLLQACPKITTLDLTGCSHISDELFFGDGHAVTLECLNKLIITNTGISSEIASVFQENMKNKLVFEETILKIVDDQLTDQTGFEEILKSKDLSKLKCIDLSDCTKLTNQMLSKLLDHLNVDAWIIKDGEKKDNPERLNLAVLNLTGCTGISDDAFDHMTDGEKITPKLLETLDRIIIGGTQISKVLEQVYPQVTFQQQATPVTIPLDPDAQLQACQAYLEKKQLAAQGDAEAEKELKKLTRPFLHNRLVIDLFSDKCKDQTMVDHVLAQPFEPNAQEFCDIALFFKINDQADPSIFYVHRDMLSNQSGDFIDGLRPRGRLNKLDNVDLINFIVDLRPGGKFNKQDNVDLINQHATPQASQLILDLVYGRASLDVVDWKTASHAAELAGPLCLNLLQSHKNALLAIIHSQFELSRAEDMFLAAKMLEDKIGMQTYEEKLLDCLNKTLMGSTDVQHSDFKIIGSIADQYARNDIYPLIKLKTKVEQIRDIQTRKLEQQAIFEETTRNEILFQRMVNSGQI